MTKEHVCKICSGTLSSAAIRQVNSSSRAVCLPLDRDYDWGEEWVVYECTGCGCLQIFDMDDFPPEQMASFYRYFEEEEVKLNRPLREQRFVSLGVNLFGTMGDSLLVYGAGLSQAPVLHSRKGWKVKACDFGEGYDYSPDKLPLEEFDVITSIEVFEHLRNPRAEVRRVLGSLKPGGWLTGSTGFWDIARAAGASPDKWWYFGQKNVMEGHIFGWTRRALAQVSLEEGCLLTVLKNHDQGILRGLCLGMPGLGQAPFFIQKV